MEFKTNTTADRDGLGVVPPPERDRYLRRKPQQKLRKSQTMSRRITRLLPALGRVVFLLGLAGLLFVIYNYGYPSEGFQLGEVVFEGRRHADAKALEALVRREFPSSILRIDLLELRKRLEAEPWVQRVELRRILPSKLVIKLEERTPAAILELQGEPMLADTDGILLDKYLSKYEKVDVPVFKGVLGKNPAEYRANQAENSARVRLGMQMLFELESGSPLFSKSISEVDVSDRKNIKLLLVDDSSEIYLGDHDFLKRYQNFVSNMAQLQELKLQYGEIMSIDLRYDGQIVYRPRGTTDARDTPATELKITPEARQ